LAKSENTTIIVNTTCRDLPRAIAGKARAFHYGGMANQIRDLIKEIEQPLSVVICKFSTKKSMLEM
jgi:hypothetical protein